jgi:nucleotide-binding universal stress UspA family protein
MRGEELADFPLRPVDVAEWEDVLLRFELGPRALRFALQDAALPAAELAGPLARLAASERRIAHGLEAMLRGGVIPEVAPDAAGAEGAEAAVAELVRRYEADRARSFATLQRRGLGVWEWTAPLEEGGEATAYRLVRHGLRSDGEALARVRAGDRGVGC